jgi:hypothetical protein
MINMANINHNFEKLLIRYISQNIEFTFTDDEIMIMNSIFKETDNQIIKNIISFWHIGQSIYVNNKDKDIWYLLEEEFSLFLYQKCKTSSLYNKIKSIIDKELINLNIFIKVSEKFTLYYILLLGFYYIYNKKVFIKLNHEKIPIDKQLTSDISGIIESYNIMLK